MKKTLSTKLGAITLALLFASASLLTLTGCNTTAGMGKDIEAAGEAIHKEADEEKRY